MAGRNDALGAGPPGGREDGSVELPLVFTLGVLILRLGLLLAGVLFCWLGYRLFAHAQTPGGAELSFKDVFKLNLYQVGPGIFFSLFGAAILVYSIHKPPSLDLRDVLHETGAARLPAAPAAATGGPAGSSAAASPAAGQRTVVIAGVRGAPADAVDPAALSRAAQQVAFVNRLDASGAVAAQDRKDVARMSRQIRLAIMRSVWQADWGDPAEFEAWERDPGAREPNPKALAFFERR
jgi:hypothetical protein